MPKKPKIYFIDGGYTDKDGYIHARIQYLTQSIKNIRNEIAYLKAEISQKRKTIRKFRAEIKKLQED